LHLAHALAQVEDEEGEDEEDTGSSSEDDK
jgi:hypothetical protein